MCGIVALFAKDESIAPENFRRATEALSHRGPDGLRYWVSPSKKVGLGHARLSIIDLATGDQPIANEDGTVHIAVNGEFYDFSNIRTDLEGRGHVFRTRSDSEIALHLYEEYGAQCVQHLRGEFAFVLWDERNRLLFAARDRFGIKPLYYANDGKTLSLASEAKALFAAGVRARWDEEAFFQFTNFLSFHSDRSLFRGIRQVPPGHYLLATENHVQLAPYWDFDYPTADAELRSSHGRDDREYAEGLADVLEEAIRLRLHADVPVGCYLSGGLDSCSVLGFAAKLSSKPLHAFSLSFDRADYDERQIAEDMAKHAKAAFYPISVRAADLADHFSDAIWHSEMPCINSHGVAKFLLSRAVREAGYKVVLTGEGADEIFAGYPAFRRDMILQGASGRDPAAVRELLDTLEDKNRISQGLLLPEGEGVLQEGVRKILGFVPQWMQAFSTLHFKFRGLYSAEFLERFGSRDAYRFFLDTLDADLSLTGRHPVHQSLYLWSKLVLPGYILNVVGDRMEMAHSVEGRVPFLDHHVVEYVQGLPVSQKICGMTEKYVLREAARPVLTHTVYRRQKHPFLAPPSFLDAGGPLYVLFQDTLRSARLASLPFFDRKKVIDLMDRLPQMDDASRTAMDNVMTTILSATLLQERFGL